MAVFRELVEFIEDLKFYFSVTIAVYVLTVGVRRVLLL